MVGAPCSVEVSRFTVLRSPCSWVCLLCVSAVLPWLCETCAIASLSDLLSVDQLCLSKQGQRAEGRFVSLCWGGMGTLGKGCQEASVLHMTCILAVSLVLACCCLSCCLRISSVNLLSDLSCPACSLAEWHPRRWSPVTNISLQTVISHGQP